MKHSVGSMIKARKGLLASATATTLMVTLSACGGSDGDGGSAGAAGGAASAGARETVIVGYQKGALGSYAINIASELGFYDDLNLDVQLVTGNSTSAGV